MTSDDVRIRDVSHRPGKEWIPPIGAMGAPTSHLLYRDLVLHAGLRLYRDRSGRPWLEMQDGGSRRTFQIPSTELRTALDRFRMRRNLRPVSEPDLNDFVRIVEARVSDPDIQIPMLERAVPSEERSPPSGPPAGGPRSQASSSSAVRRIIDSTFAPPPRAAPAPSVPPPTASEGLSVSGGHMGSTGPPGDLRRYVQSLRDLTRQGGWLGTSEDLARRTGDRPEAVGLWLDRYRSALLQENLVVTAVRLEEGWRWLAVDRERIRPEAIATPSSSSGPKDSTPPRARKKRK